MASVKGTRTQTHKELKENETKAEIPSWQLEFCKNDVLKPPNSTWYFCVVYCSLYGETYFSKQGTVRDKNRETALLCLNHLKLTAECMCLLL